MICIFSPNIASLIVFRATEAVGIASAIVVGAGVIADIYPPVERGPAFGIFGIPPLVGPIVGPIIGGAIATAFGWRGTFVLLAILGLIVIAGIFFFVPETLHYFVLQNDLKLIQQDPVAAKEKGLKEENLPNLPKPVMLPPWKPFVFLKDPQLVLIACVSGF